MELKIATIVVGILLSCVFGLAGYWLKSVYQEFKILVREFTSQINELTQMVMVLQTIIESAVEEDIKELKEDVKTLYKKCNNNESKIASIKKDK